MSNTSTPALEKLLARSEAILEKLEALLPAPPATPDWEAGLAFRWQRYASLAGLNMPGYLQHIRQLPGIRLADLSGIDAQKARVVANTRQFLSGRPANNVLLTGSRGSGKSSLVKALLHEFADQRLRLIEVDKGDLVDLPQLIDCIAERPEYFIIFCDDLSFEAGESAYKALKVALDGGIATMPANTLIYATSNRRHLMPEYFTENLESTRRSSQSGEEIHPGESSEEKISLSERFGLWISFYPFSQEDYLAIVGYWLKHFGCGESQAARQDALNWAIQRGSRSGRVAWQFARDWAGTHGS